MDPISFMWTSSSPNTICWTNYHFFLSLIIYLFLFLVALVIHCWVQAFSSCGGYSSLWCMGFSLQWLLLLWSTGSRHMGSVVVRYGLSCSVACEIFPDQESNPHPLQQADPYPLYHQGSPLNKLSFPPLCSLGMGRSSSLFQLTS